MSKQAVHGYAQRQSKIDDQLFLLISEVDQLRKEHPGCGVEKMYYTLNPGFIGRDKFTSLFMQLGYGLKQPKNYRKTTWSSQVYYPNLIGGMQVNAPSVVWQSDITYIELNGTFYYAVFILDVYTRQIVGYRLSDSLRAEANIKALQMALKKHKPPDIHHSDRGSQYIYKPYVNQLKELGCKISMGKLPQQNAYAERINRTIKEEYLNHWKINDYKQLRLKLKKAVHHYNMVRPHKALGYKSPKQYNDIWEKQSKNKPILTIFDYQ